MEPLTDAHVYSVQAEPSQIEVDAQGEVSEGDPSWWMVAVPVIVAVLALIQKRTPDKADHLTAITQAYQHQVTTSAEQIKTLTEQDAQTQERLRVLKHDVSTTRRRSDVSERIAHKALDRVDDHRTYLEVRDMNDPDGTLTPWVPNAPKHLMDPEWTAKHRTTLDSFGD